MFCPNCGKEVSDGVKFCPSCGKEVEAAKNEKKTESSNTQENQSNAVVENVNSFSDKVSVPDYQNDDFICAFLAEENNTDTFRFYKNAFSKYNVNGVEKFALVWTWWGFFFSSLMLIYRRLYVEAVIWIVASSILAGSTAGVLGLLVLVAGGVLPPYLIYKKFMRIIRRCNELNMGYEQKIQTLKEAGGLSSLIVIIIAGVFIIGAIVVVIALLYGLFS